MHDTAENKLETERSGTVPSWIDHLEPFQCDANGCAEPLLPPTAMQAEVDVHDTAAALRTTLATDQRIPFQRSVSGKVPASLSTPPTARQTLRELHDTPAKSGSSTLSLGTGCMGCKDQVEPSQCSATGSTESLLDESRPTALQIVFDAHDTANSSPNAVVRWMDYFVPFQRSTSEFAPAPVYPTAVHAPGDEHDTAVNQLSDELAGTRWIDHRTPSQCSTSGEFK